MSAHASVSGHATSPRRADVASRVLLTFFRPKARMGASIAERRCVARPTRLPDNARDTRAVPSIDHSLEGLSIGRPQVGEIVVVCPVWIARNVFWCGERCE